MAPGTLTDEETRILNLIAHGYLNKQICGELGLTTGMINLRIRTIIRRLLAVNRAHAVAIAKDRGLI